MIRPTIFLAITFLFFMILSLSIHDAAYRVGTPGFAACTTEEIKNKCCYEFLELMKSELETDQRTTREDRAVRGYVRCLRSVNCSQEMIEMKAKNIRQIRSICGE